MLSTFQIEVPQPCQKNWDAMTPQSGGRFCSSCEKKVIDFSLMSDDALKAFFKKPPVDGVCGRFKNNQLQKGLATSSQKIPWLKYFFTIAIPTVLISTKGYSQGTPLVRKKIASHSNKDSTNNLLQKQYNIADSLRGDPNLLNLKDEYCAPSGKQFDDSVRQVVITMGYTITKKRKVPMPLRPFVSIIDKAKKLYHRLLE